MSDGNPSFYPESHQHIMYSEKGMKIIRPLWQLQDWQDPGQSMLFALKAKKQSDVFMSSSAYAQLSCLPSPLLYTRVFTYVHGNATLQWSSGNACWVSSPMSTERWSRGFKRAVWVKGLGLLNNVFSWCGLLEPLFQNCQSYLLSLKFHSEFSFVIFISHSSVQLTKWK